MRPTSLRTLAATTAVVAVLAWSALSVWESRGNGLLPVPWTAPVGMGLVAGVLLVLARPVRTWTRRDRTGLHQAGRDRAPGERARDPRGAQVRRPDPLRAARLLVLARATAHAGSALAGLYLAHVALALPDVDVEPRRAAVLVGLAATAAALGMVAAGLTVERWCRLPPDDDEDDDNLSVAG